MLDDLAARQHRVSSIEHPASSILYPVSSIQHRLDPIASNICQFIFDVVINPFFVGRQSIFSAAGPAAQTNGLSGSLYPNRRLAMVALEKMWIHIFTSLT